LSIWEAAVLFPLSEKVLGRKNNFILALEQSIKQYLRYLRKGDGNGTY
jgi:hypothetical protein